MAESVSTAVEVDVEEATTVHGPGEGALAPLDDQVDTAVGPELCLVRIPELFRLLEHLCLRVEAEEVVVVHRPFPGGGGSAGGRARVLLTHIIIGPTERVNGSRTKKER